jgi:hypothetical protein
MDGANNKGKIVRGLVTLAIAATTLTGCGGDRNRAKLEAGRDAIVLINQDGGEPFCMSHLNHLRSGDRVTVLRDSDPGTRDSDFEDREVDCRVRDGEHAGENIAINRRFLRLVP